MSNPTAQNVVLETKGIGSRVTVGFKPGDANNVKSIDSVVFRYAGYDAGKHTYTVCAITDTHEIWKTENFTFLLWDGAHSTENLGIELNKIGDNGKQLAFDDNGDLIALRTDGTDGIYKYDSTGKSWISLGEGYKQIAAGKYLYAITNDNKIKQYSVTGNTWNLIGDSGYKQIAAAGDNLYAIINDAGNTIKKYSGTGTTWNTVGNTAPQIAAGGDCLYAIMSNNTLLAYSGSDTRWVSVPGGDSIKAISITSSGSVIAIKQDGRVYVLTGPTRSIPQGGIPATWENAITIFATTQHVCVVTQAQPKSIIINGLVTEDRREAEVSGADGIPLGTIDWSTYPSV